MTFCAIREPSLVLELPIIITNPSPNQGVIFKGIVLWKIILYATKWSINILSVLIVEFWSKIDEKFSKFGEILNICTHLKILPVCLNVLLFTNIMNNKDWHLNYIICIFSAIWGVKMPAFFFLQKSMETIQFLVLTFMRFKLSSLYGFSESFFNTPWPLRYEGVVR